LLEPDELADFQSLLPGMFDALDPLVNMPSGTPAVTYRDRDPGSRPPPAENPLLVARS
jgi:hypothetical protein